LRIVNNQIAFEMVENVYIFNMEGKIIGLLVEYWYLWLLILLMAVLRMCKPLIKGWFGEKTVSFYLRRLPRDEYTLLNNVILPTSDGTTQIDHIVVSLYGIFVIETKNYTGWIFGDEKSAQWTQNIYGQKRRFMNPIRQNYAHVKAVEACLAQYPDVLIISVVAFSPECDLKVRTTSHVVYFHRINELIRSYTDRVIRPDAMSAICATLRDANMCDRAVAKEHVELVLQKKQAVEEAAAGNACPKCDGTLIERNGRYGAFLGCSNFPRCRFVKKI